MPYTTQIMQVDRTHQQFASYPEHQQVFAIDVPGARAIQQQQQQASAEYLNYHRDSESASSVSSQGTLMDSRLSPIHHTYKRASIYQQHQQQQQYVQQPFASTPVADADRNMCEEDVFTAASILMSLRTCKMPC
ncbi:hypothetical protein FBU59_005828 [Linderina macrospora]|uniref:Uncharacterized protein n=1 Tax=Linderina macrospora TaxID=4868 RepID=A0ACC1J1P2_9FUNG|nr:hypothetical protein FBU59_005828 [Linderina macrospora]